MFNSEKTIKECINSVLSQTYKNIEILAIDNNSKDETFNIAKKLLKDHIVISEKRQGVSFARNTGLEKATGKYICFLDSDDYLTKDSIEKRVKHLISTKTLVTYGNYIRFNSKSQKLISPPDKIDKNNIYHQNHIGNLTGMYDAEVIGKIYQENIGHEDYEMWIQIIKKANFICLKTKNINLGFYRIGNKTISSNKIKAAIWHYKIIDRHVKNKAKVIFYLFKYSFNNLLKTITK